jgi:nicotinamidase/pyrazinamidase
MKIVDNAALLVTDVQNCFCPDGSLGVPEGDDVVPRLNRYIERFRDAGQPVFYSRDWHPEETVHFDKWPPHCVQQTEDAEFHPELLVVEDAIVVSKGMDPDADAYSAFEAVGPDGRYLEELLKERGVRHLYVGGLALDYCVKFSALDALKAGLEVTLLIDATRAVNVEPHDGEKAVEELVREGVDVTTLERIAEAGNRGR